MLRLRKCTGMSVYRVRECLSCLKRLKGAAKRPETIHALGETLIVKNIREVREFIRGYRCSSIRAVAELSRIVMELYSREPFKIHQVCAIITSKLLAHGRKESRNERSSVEVSENIVGVPTCLDRVITRVELRLLTRDPETKRQLMHTGQNLNSPRQKNVKISKF